MVERHLVVDHLRFSYEGLFNAAELYNLIAEWYFEKGWDWLEKINQEQVTPAGRQFHIVLEPWKSASDYYKIAMKIVLNMTDVKEVEVEHEGQNLNLNYGAVKITFDGFVLSDRMNKWTKQPFYWLLSVLFEKYFFRNHYEKMHQWIESDVDDLHAKIKNYLNVFKYSYRM